MSLENFVGLVTVSVVTAFFTALLVLDYSTNSWIEIKACEVACKTHEGLYEIYADGDCICRDTTSISRFDAKKQ